MTSLSELIREGISDWLDVLPDTKEQSPMSPEKAAQIVDMNPAKDYVAIRELVKAGRTLAAELEQATTDPVTGMKEQVDRLRVLVDKLDEAIPTPGISAHMPVCAKCNGSGTICLGSDCGHMDCDACNGRGY